MFPKAPAADDLTVLTSNDCSTAAVTIKIAQATQQSKGFIDAEKDKGGIGELTKLFLHVTQGLHQDKVRSVEQNRNAREAKEQKAVERKKEEANASKKHRGDMGEEQARVLG